MVSRASPETSVSLRPSSFRNEMSEEFISPGVSRASAGNMCEAGRDEYFDVFLAATCSAALPGLAETVV